MKSPLQGGAKGKEKKRMNEEGYKFRYFSIIRNRCSHDTPEKINFFFEERKK
jgi:hypothetical protein